MNILTKVNNEAANTSHIYLYKEGIFYEAYERSAYAFSIFIKRFKLKRAYSKTVGSDVISLGFPISGIENMLVGREYTKDESDNICMTWNEDETIVASAYEEWRMQVKNECTPSTPRLPKSHDVDVVTMIREFPIEIKSPIECILFLGELKKICSQHT